MMKDINISGNWDIYTLFNSNFSKKLKTGKVKEKEM